jgi:hypothetical protein
VSDRPPTIDEALEKPRVRVPVATAPYTADTFQNFAANLGYGTNNFTSASTYGFNPISRNRQLLEWMYRGSWLVRKVIDCPADDMTREGVSIESDMSPDDIDELTEYWNNLEIWHNLNLNLKWGRLYGGALAVLMIDGQDPQTPLRVETIGRGMFKGLVVLDRWMVWPNPVTVQTPGRDFGKPAMYDIVADSRSIPRMRVHHSRVIRFDGSELPYWQRLAENEWSLSVIEPLWDRMIAFDSATQGAAQLIYKAHLRVVKIPQYRELIASGGPLYTAVVQMLNMIRMMQTNEGMTVIDGEDEFQANQYSFGGLSDMMIQFGQQVSGAADIPMTRLFGQSPAGMNSTGESDLRNYYDGIRSLQEFRMRPVIKKLFEITHRSLRGVGVPKGFNFTFKPLWQLSEPEKAQIATAHAGATTQLMEAGVFTPVIAMKEIRQSSHITGFGSNITDEDIEAAENAPPMPGMEGAPQPGMEGEQPPQDPSQGPPPGPDDQSGQGGETDASQFALPLPVRRHQTAQEAGADEAVATGGATGLFPKTNITTARINLARGIHARANLPGGVVVNFKDWKDSVMKRKATRDAALLNKYNGASDVQTGD